jgi:hypothetical protein
MCQFAAYQPEKVPLSRRTFTCPNRIRKFRYGLVARAALPGEMSVLLDQPHTATVRAVENRATCLFLARKITFAIEDKEIDA